MAAIHETAYPVLGYSFTLTEVWELFTPSDEELAFVQVQKIDVANRGRLLTLLKVFQHLGYFPMWSAIPKEISYHLANVMGYLFPLPKSSTLTNNFIYLSFGERDKVPPQMVRIGVRIRKIYSHSTIFVTEIMAE